MKSINFNILRIIISIFVLISIMPTAYPQASFDPQRVINIPSPNMAEIGKYTTFPTTENSGVPPINIPLTEVKTRTGSLPIELQYHAAEATDRNSHQASKRHPYEFEVCVFVQPLRKFRPTHWLIDASHHQNWAARSV